MRKSISRILSGRFSGALTGIILKTFGLGLAFVFTALASHGLGALNFGYFIYIYSFYLFASPIANCGYPPLLVRYGKEMFDEGDHAAASKLLWTSVAYTVLAAIVLSGGLVIASDFGVGQLYRGGGWQFLAMFALGTILVALQALFRNAQIAFRREFAANLHFYVYRNLFPLLAIALAFAAGAPDLEIVLPAFVASYLLIVALDAWNLRTMLRPVASPGITSEGKTPAPYYTWVSESVGSLLARGDVLFVGYMLGVKEAGGYFIAQRIAVLAQFALDGGRSYFAPRLSEAFHRKSTIADRNAIIDEVSTLYFLAALVCAVPLMVVAPFLLQMFEVEASGVLACIYILIVSQVIAAVFGPVNYILDFGGMRAQRGALSIIALAATPFLYWSLISSLGLIGAGLATSAVNLVIAVGGVSYSYRTFQRWTGLRLGSIKKELSKFVRELVR